MIPMSSVSRLAKLRMRPQYGHLPDDLLKQMLEEALADFLAYTNRRADPGDEADSVIIDLAAIKLNGLGLEGFKRGKDGEVEREYDMADTRIYLRMDRWRVAMWPRSS